MEEQMDERVRTDEELVAGLLELLAVGTGLARDAMRARGNGSSPTAAWLGQTGALFAMTKGARRLFEGVELGEELREQIEGILRDA
jgi:hypothetical protein